MEGRGAQGFTRRLVLRGAVALVSGELVARIYAIETFHELVALLLGKNRCGADGIDAVVATNNCLAGQEFTRPADWR